MGRAAAVKAINLYSALNTPDGFTKAADLGEALLAALPPGEFATEAGWAAVNNWRARVSMGQEHGGRQQDDPQSAANLHP